MSDEGSQKPDAPVLPVDASVNQSGVSAESNGEEAPSEQIDEDEDIDETVSSGPNY